MGIGFQAKIIVHEVNKTQNVIIELELSIALDENQESTFVNAARGVSHVLQEIGHGFEGADLSELAENLVVEGGSGFEVGLLGGPLEEPKRRGFVVLATEGVEKLG